MGFDGVLRLTAVVGLSLFLLGCGLDGVRGTVLTIKENRYVIRDLSGKERLIYIDERSRRDGAEPGDEVRVFVTRDGYAAYIQKIKP